jgi:hypothetical protein
MKVIAPDFIPALINPDMLSEQIVNLTISEINRLTRKQQDMESTAQQRVHAEIARRILYSTLVCPSPAGVAPSSLVASQASPLVFMSLSRDLRSNRNGNASRMLVLFHTNFYL